MKTRALGAMTAVVAASALLAGCGSGVQSEFVAGCRDGGATEEICECMYDKLEAHYGFDAMEAMQTKGVMPPDFMNQGALTAAQCRGIDLSGSIESATEEGALSSSPAINGSADAGPGASASDQSLIDQAIQITASAVSGGEYRDARLAASGDVNADGRDDAAVVFTIEVASTNTATQNLAVFVRQDDGNLRFAGSTVVGSQGGAAVGRMAIEQGAVVLTTLSLGPNDPDCCPSVEERTRFELSGSALRQVQ